MRFIIILIFSEKYGGSVMQLKKLTAGVLVVLGLFLVAFSVNSSNNAASEEAYATTTVSTSNKNTKTNLKNISQAKSYLDNKYGENGWESTAYTPTKNGNSYWTFVALKDSQNGMIKAGHTLYVHVDGSVVY